MFAQKQFFTLVLVHMQTDLWKSLNKNEKRLMLEKIRSMRKAREEAAIQKGNGGTEDKGSVEEIQDSATLVSVPSVPKKTLGAPNSGILENLQLGINASIVVTAASDHLSREKEEVSSSVLRKPRKTRKSKKDTQHPPEEVSPFGFADVIRSMMHAFGDAAEPERASAILIERSAIAYGMEVLSAIRSHLGRDTLRLVDFSRLLPVTTLMFFRWKTLRNLARTDVHRKDEAGEIQNTDGHVDVDADADGDADVGVDKEKSDIGVLDGSVGVVTGSVEDGSGSFPTPGAELGGEDTPGVLFTLSDAGVPEAEMSEIESSAVPQERSPGTVPNDIADRDAEIADNSLFQGTDLGTDEGVEQVDIDDDTLSELYLARSRRDLLLAQQHPASYPAHTPSTLDPSLPADASGVSFGSVDEDRAQRVSGILESRCVIPPEFYERLEFANSRSAAMTELQYGHFVTCREAGFLRGRKLSTLFAALFPPPTLTSACLEVLSYIVYDYVGKVIEGANRLMGSGSLTDNFYTPLPQVAIVTSISCQPSIPPELEEVVQATRQKRERMEAGALLRMARTRRR